MVARVLGVTVGLVLLPGLVMGADASATFDQSTQGIDVSYVSTAYEGAAQVFFTGTKGEDWLVHASSYHPYVIEVYVNSTTMGSSVYVSEETPDSEEDTSQGWCLVGVWIALEDVSPQAFLLSLYWDQENDDEWDGNEEDPIQDTIWMYTF